MTDLRISFDEPMVGANHPTKADTLNRLALVEHNNDGTHRLLTNVTDPWIDVRAHGAVGDGVTDDSASIQSALDAIPATGGVVLFGPGTYLVGTTLALPYHEATIVFNGTTISSTVAGPAIKMGTRNRLIGQLTVDCNSTAGSEGISFISGSGENSRHFNHIEYAIVRNASCGLRMTNSGDTDGVYYNHVGYFLAEYCTTGLSLDCSSTLARVNSNRFDAVFTQNCTDGVVVDHADGNGVGHLECEGNGRSGGGIDGPDSVQADSSGWGLKVTRCKGFQVHSGWCERNGDASNGQGIEIANHPEVLGAFVGMNISGWPSSVSYTYNGSRSVVIRNQQYYYQLGRTFAERVDIGPLGNAADDQAVQDYLRVSGGMYCYRFNPGNPYFFFDAPTSGVGYMFRDNGGARTQMRLEGGDPASGNTAMYLLYNNGASATLQRVTVGAADSGGTGYKVLRVPN